MATRRTTKRILATILVLFMALGAFQLQAKTVTLTSTQKHIVSPRPGTVTFKFSNDVHVGKAKDEGLRHISGNTYSAAIIYDISFENGCVASYGKMFNYTDKPVRMTCSFYSGRTLVAQYTIDIKPRTFMRMIPSGELSTVRSCDRIVCTD